MKSLKELTSVKVNEIYFSIQGESTYTGKPCIFIRLTGCDLRCSYCDSEYTFYEGNLVSFEDIFKKISEYPCRLVEITGGEPMIHQGTPLLAKKLLESGYKVLIETSGSQDLSTLDSRVIKICDVKTPSSKEEGRFFWDNLKCLNATDQLKFVIGTREDFEFSQQWLNDHPTSAEIQFSTVFGTLPPDSLADWILKSGINVRMQIQLHKVIWPQAARGV